MTIDRSTLVEQARALADSGEYQQAAVKFRECLQRFPDSDEAYFMLGIISERMGDSKAAEDYLRRVVYLNPDHYEALCQLALLAEQRGDTAAANATRARAARVFQRRAGQRAEDKHWGTR